MEKFRSYRETCSYDLARGLGVDPHYVRWIHVPSLRDEALVLHAPWARIVLARSPSGVYRFLDDYWRGRNTWIRDSLFQRYPIEAQEAIPARNLLDTPTNDLNLKGFIRWAVHRRPKAGWPVAKDLRVIGSWTAYRDAILVKQKDGRVAVRKCDSSAILGTEIGHDYGKRDQASEDHGLSST